MRPLQASIHKLSAKRYTEIGLSGFILTTRVIRRQDTRSLKHAQTWKRQIEWYYPAVPKNIINKEVDKRICRYMQLANKLIKGIPRSLRGILEAFISIIQKYSYLLHVRFHMNIGRKELTLWLETHSNVAFAMLFPKTFEKIKERKCNCNCIQRKEEIPWNNPKSPRLEEGTMEHSR